MCVNVCVHVCIRHVHVWGTVRVCVVRLGRGCCAPVCVCDVCAAAGRSQLGPRGFLRRRPGARSAPSAPSWAGRRITLGPCPPRGAVRAQHPVKEQPGSWVQGTRIFGFRDAVEPGGRWQRGSEGHLVIHRRGGGSPDPPSSHSRGSASPGVPVCFPCC